MTLSPVPSWYPDVSDAPVFLAPFVFAASLFAAVRGATFLNVSASTGLLSYIFVALPVICAMIITWSAGDTLNVPSSPSRAQTAVQTTSTLSRIAARGEEAAEWVGAAAIVFLFTFVLYLSAVHEAGIPADEAIGNMVLFNLAFSFCINVVFGALVALRRLEEYLSTSLSLLVRDFRSWAVEELEKLRSNPAFNEAKMCSAHLAVWAFLVVAVPIGLTHFLSNGDEEGVAFAIAIIWLDIIFFGTVALLCAAFFCLWVLFLLLAPAIRALIRALIAGVAIGDQIVRHFPKSSFVVRSRREPGLVAIGFVIGGATGIIVAGNGEGRLRAVLSGVGIALAIYTLAAISSTIAGVFFFFQKTAETCLTYVQQEVLYRLSLQAKKHHDRDIYHLMGLFSRAGVSQCLRYIREDAEIVIHVSEETVQQQLSKDSHYRNLFETGTSGGCSVTAARARWERNMFGNYYYGAAPFDRPKYGCINVFGNVDGCIKAHCYGKCFVVLRSEVKERCTMWCGNHSEKDAGSVQLGTFEFFAHVLKRFSNDQLLAVLQFSNTGNNTGLSPVPLIEVQIHGPLRLDRDVQALSVPGYADCCDPEWWELLHEFGMKNNCEIVFQDGTFFGNSD